MRETRLYGSEGGRRKPSLPLSGFDLAVLGGNRDEQA